MGVYLSAVALAGMVAAEKTIWFVLIVIAIATAVLGVYHMFSDVSEIKEKNWICELDAVQTLSLRDLCRMKLWPIPVFILNFAYWFILMLVPAGFVFAIFLPIDVIFIYSVVLTSAVTGVKTISLYEQAGVLEHGKAMIHKVLQFVFVLDVIDTIYLRIKLPQVGIMKQEKRIWN